MQVAQWLAHVPSNSKVGGSNPPLGRKTLFLIFQSFVLLGPAWAKTYDMIVQKHLST